MANTDAEAQYNQHQDDKICFTRLQVEALYLNQRAILTPVLGNPNAITLQTVCGRYICKGNFVITLTGYIMSLAPHNSRSRDNFVSKRPLPPTANMRNWAQMRHWYCKMVAKALNLGIFIIPYKEFNPNCNST